MLSTSDAHAGIERVESLLASARDAMSDLAAQMTLLNLHLLALDRDAPRSDAVMSQAPPDPAGRAGARPD
ncbi:MAG TPA: hypothetical protein VLK60_05105 [Variovorax sp.]|nr:hypothetical protein [Variovorax sp.]